MAPGKTASGDAAHAAPKAAKGGVHSSPSSVLLALKDAAAGLDRQGADAGDAVWRRNLRGDAAAATLRGPRPASWWTGLAPALCPGVQPDGSLTSLPLPVRLPARAARDGRERRGAARASFGALGRAGWPRWRGEGCATNPAAALGADAPRCAGHRQLYPAAVPGLLQQHVDAD